MTTTTKGRGGRKPTEAQKAQAQEKAAAFKTLAAQLSGELKEGKHTERLARVAHDAPGLERYSPLNQLLILAQCPEATETYGYVEWKQRGYQVRKGESGIAIRAPHQRRKAATAEGEEGGGVGFHRIYVFDRSQVEPIPDEAPATEEFNEDDFDGDDL